MPRSQGHLLSLQARSSFPAQNPEPTTMQAMKTRANLTPSLSWLCPLPKKNLPQLPHSPDLDRRFTYCLPQALFILLFFNPLPVSKASDGPSARVQTFSVFVLFLVGDEGGLAPFWTFATLHVFTIAPVFCCSSSNGGARRTTPWRFECCWRFEFC